MKKPSLNKEHLLLLLLLALASIIRIYMFFISDNGMPGAFDKIYSIRKWIDSGQGMPELVTGPLHTYLVWIGLLLYKNILISPRLVSLFFGLASLFPYYYLVRLLFDRTIAQFSTLFLCIFATHVHISVVSLPMSQYIFFLLCSLYCFFLYKKELHLNYLIISAINLGLASMLRYEGWLFIPILASLLFNKKRKIHLFIFGIIASLAPLLFMTISYRETGNPLWMLTLANKIALSSEENLPLNIRLFGWFYIFTRILSPIGFILSITGIILYRKEKLPAQVLFIVSVNLIVFISKSFQGTYDPLTTKYSSPLILLIVPYLFSGAERILYILITHKIWPLKHLPAVLVKSVSIILLFINLASSSIKEINRNIKEYRIPADLKKIVNWINRNATDQDIFLIDFNYYGYITIMSGLDFDQFLNPSLDISTGKIIEDEFWQTLKQKKSLYVVYSFQEGDLPRLLNLSRQTTRQQVNGITFKKIYTENNWTLFLTTTQ